MMRGAGRARRLQADPRRTGSEQSRRNRPRSPLRGSEARAGVRRSSRVQMADDGSAPKRSRLADIRGRGTRRRVNRTSRPEGFVDVGVGLLRQGGRGRGHGRLQARRLHPQGHHGLPPDERGLVVASLNLLVAGAGAHSIEVTAAGAAGGVMFAAGGRTYALSFSCAGAIDPAGCVGEAADKNVVVVLNKAPPQFWDEPGVTDGPVVVPDAPAAPAAAPPPPPEAAAPAPAPARPPQRRRPRRRSPQSLPF
ncbi:hypothetical protein M885DRAFT_527046 [Pelagophyceae sp. CCMP2097]|nr:hypothetical protein M885DRAFT_527046 [Pelagophyceae sp. CCMP2097]